MAPVGRLLSHPGVSASMQTLSNSYWPYLFHPAGSVASLFLTNHARQPVHPATPGNGGDGEGGGGGGGGGGEGRVALLAPWKESYPISWVVRAP